MPVIEVVGLASGRSTMLRVSPSDLSKNLLEWLRSKGITIASSCDGEGVCKRCFIQNGWLTCELSLEEFLEREPNGKVFVNYL